MTTLSAKLVARFADSIEFASARARTLQTKANGISAELNVKMAQHQQQLRAEVDRLLAPLSDDEYLATWEAADRLVEERREKALQIARAQKQRERERALFAERFPELVGNFF
jgi:flagellar biosynthesis regulator FlbT